MNHMKAFQEFIKPLEPTFRLQENEYSSITTEQAMALRRKASKLSMLTPQRYASALESLRKWVSKEGLNKRDVTSVVGARLTSLLMEGNAGDKGIGGKSV